MAPGGDRRGAAHLAVVLKVALGGILLAVALLAGIGQHGGGIPGRASRIPPARPTLCAVTMTRATFAMVVRGTGAVAYCQQRVAALRALERSRVGRTAAVGGLGHPFYLRSDPAEPRLCRVRFRRTGRAAWIEDTVPADPFGARLCQLLTSQAAQLGA